MAVAFLSLATLGARQPAFAVFEEERLRSLGTDQRLARRPFVVVLRRVVVRMRSPKSATVRFRICSTGIAFCARAARLDVVAVRFWLRSPAPMEPSRRSKSFHPKR